MEHRHRSMTGLNLRENGGRELLYLTGIIVFADVVLVD